jgi:cation diffusion facilitator family transporter
MSEAKPAAAPSHLPPLRRAHELRAAITSLIVGGALLAVKFTAYWLTGSAAIFSDALESIVNVLASALALYSVVLAHRPADPEHPYGHGKVEFMSAGFEGGMMLLAAIVIVFRAVEQLVRGASVQRIDSGLVLIVLAMGINGTMGWYLVSTGKRSGSIVLEADGSHLLTDALTSAGVLGALVVVKVTGWARADPIAALGVAAYVAFSAMRLLRRSAAGLMDEQDREDDRLLRQILDSHLGPAGREPRICSYHKLRHRHSGRFHWVDFHVMVPASWNVDQGHRVASSIEYEIEVALVEANATAHVEPCVAATCRNCGT